MSARGNVTLLERLIRFGSFRIYQRARIKWFWYLSDRAIISGEPIMNNAVLFIGKGQIKLGLGARFGVYPSPGYFNTYSHIEARSEEASIEIGAQVYLNNNACLISDGAGIRIGDRCLIGHNFTAFDSDFHEMDPARRREGTPAMAPVVIGENVFIGSNVTVLKGVTIGDNCVIAANSVVVSSVPDNQIAGGNPCRVLKALDPGATLDAR